MNLLNPDAKIEIIWELGHYTRDNDYIPPKDNLFDICIDMDNELGIEHENLSDDVLYDVLTDYLKLPKTVVLSGLESGHPSIDDYRYIYDVYLVDISNGFAPKYFKEIK